jgi:hypothetical protein
VLEEPGADRQVTQDAVSGEAGGEQPSETIQYYWRCPRMAGCWLTAGMRTPVEWV